MSQVELKTYFPPGAVLICYSYPEPGWTAPYLHFAIGAGHFKTDFMLSPDEAIAMAELIYREAMALKNAEAAPELIAFELEPAA